VSKIRPGKALKAILSGSTEVSADDIRKSAKSPLRHPVRRRILEYLSRRPCSSLTGISAEFRIALPTVKWHLAKLLEEKYVRKADMGKLVVFYPEDLLDAGDIPLLSMLCNGMEGKALAAIIEQPGLKTGELAGITGLDYQACARAARRLESSNLVASVSDGRSRRHYPTNLLPQRSAALSRRADTFRRTTVRRMEDERLKPKVLSSKIGGFTVSALILGERFTMTFSTQPYATVLA